MVAGAPSADSTWARVIPGEMVFSLCWARRAAGMESRAIAIRWRMGERSSSGCDALKNGFEEREAVCGAQDRVHRALRMRHHTQHIAFCADDSGDIAHRAVGIVALEGLQRIGRIPEHDLAFTLQPVEGFVVGTVASVTVRDWQRDELARLIARRERGVRVFDAQRDGGADELERRIAQQRTGQEAGLAGDLEAVAESD